MKLLKCFSIFIFFSYTSMTFASVVHHIQYDQLVGATGIDINGENYQVQFADSSCMLLFNNCDETTDFFFPDAQSGLEANLALLEQVLLDLPSGLFDSEPELTHGCYSNIQCSIVTPIGSVAPQLEVFPAVFLINKADQRSDVHTGSGSAFRAADFGLRNSNADTLTYAIWSKEAGSAVSVPVPASFLLYSSALVAILIMKDRPLTTEVTHI